MMKTTPPQDLRLRTFFKNLAAEIFQFDSTTRRTISTLLRRPGQLTRAYFTREGEAYVPPVRFYFIINFLFFLLIPILSNAKFQVFEFSLENLSGQNPYYQRLVDEQVKSLGLSKDIYRERFNAHLKYNKQAFVFLVIPLFAFFLKLFFFNKKYYYLQHLFFSLHFLCFFLISLVLAMLLNRVIIPALSLIAIPTSISIAVLVFGLFIALLVHIFAAIRRYYEEGLLAALLKTPLVFAGFFFSMATFYAQFLFFYTILALRQ